MSKAPEQLTEMNRKAAEAAHEADPAFDRAGSNV